MATFLPENVAFDKMTQFDTAITEIHQTFDSLIDQLIARRDALLQRVQELREEHRNKETNRVAAIEELERVQQQMQDMNIKANQNLEFQKQVKLAYQQGMKKLEPSATFLCPLFKCQSKDTIRQLIAELGEVITCEIPDYSLKEEPVLTAGKFGSGANELNATGITIDKSTELMYIADCWNSRIQIVSQKGEFVTQFRNHKLINPWGISVDKECIFVTDTECHALFQFRKRDFKLTNRTGGTKGNREGEMNTPHGLCIDTNGDVLVADCYNDRLSVFSKLLKFKSCIGIGQLYCPQDVKLSADRIVVLDWSPLCVLFFSREGHLLSSCLSRGDTQDCLLANPSSFCLDAVDNIIICDWKLHVIKIFKVSGRHIHTLGRKGEGRGQILGPLGICITKLGTICVASENPNYPLQWF